ncbi:hypothetical protein QL285_080539 [Trifolium repens]|nr:hypothetical protein QL285_080539 [Trifolium repens]
MHFNPSQIHNFYPLVSELQLLNNYKLLLVTASMFEPAVMFGHVATATMTLDGETNLENGTRLNRHEGRGRRLLFGWIEGLELEIIQEEMCGQGKCLPQPHSGRQMFLLML